MATKKVVKKVVKKASTTVEGVKFTHGDYFSATIDGASCYGRVSIAVGNVYLCQNRKDGASAVEYFGMRYSWGIGSSLYNNGVKNYKKITKAEFDSKKLPTYPRLSNRDKNNKAGYPVLKRPDNRYVFGCGAVILSEKDIKEHKAYLEAKPNSNVLKALENKDLTNAQILTTINALLKLK